VQEIYRVLDANFNRAREGLRVTEEVARFILEDPQLTARLKDLRHRLITLQKCFPGGLVGLIEIGRAHV